MNNIFDYPGLIILILIIALWDLTWKLIAMWKSSRRDQLIWFIFLGIINSAGILPIIYLLIYKGLPEKMAEA